MKETELKIKILGNPALRTKSKPISSVTARHRKILSEMARIMYAASGVGLAAPQVGINEQMIVVDIGSGLYKLINPKILRKKGSWIMEEGCLSVPGIYIKVKRAKKILLQAEDEFGKPLKMEAQELLARVFQHEIDHLKGKLIVDYASLFDKMKVRKAVKELLLKSKDEKLSEQSTESCKLQL